MERNSLLTNEKSNNTLKDLKYLEDGIHEDGDSGADLIPPKDFDMAKFDRGRNFFRDNLFSCCVGMFFALILGLCFPDFLETLVFTNKSETPRKAHRRYVSTFKHIASWHYGNVWKKGSEAQKSILIVRKMHKRVRAEMAKDGRGHYLSQYNMVLVQSAFIAFPLMHSQNFGIKASVASLDDYVYFWYGIGHLLGIDPKYNISSHGVAQAKFFCENIRDNVVVPNLKYPGEDFYKMSNALVVGWKGYLHGTLSVPFHFEKGREGSASESD
ncbi:hypothetical protein RRG08_009340 [Elysia crispata]|uniref:ER-bound oxygenase mpaB/mpaB'/Rubber oxygenase catalytic domain-containing protein n=1 Tax=Elysia crispata TaxID=231223 RepID=A0AAE1CT10_9GAST|nr:hypothetical protein RRG08_009340 [Elysia crispata]